MFSIAHLDTLRRAEIDKIITCLPLGSRVLEVGAGTGRQAQFLALHGYSVEAIEIAGSKYAGDRMFPVTDYDGRTIPFADSSFDVVFSSNVLEHVADLTRMHAEIRRVLRPDGRAVHVLPTHAWRIWSTLGSPLGGVLNAMAVVVGRPDTRSARAGSMRFVDPFLKIGGRLAAGFSPRRHGERGNIVSETWLFRPDWWRSNFAENGFEVVTDEPMGVFYTGNMLLGARWPIAGRERAARVLGSACHLFQLRAKR